MVVEMRIRRKGNPEGGVSDIGYQERVGSRGQAKSCFQKAFCHTQDEIQNTNYKSLLLEAW